MKFIAAAIAAVLLYPAAAGAVTRSQAVTATGSYALHHCGSLAYMCTSTVPIWTRCNPTGANVARQAQWTCESAVFRARKLWAIILAGGPNRQTCVIRAGVDPFGAILRPSKSCQNSGI